MFFCGNLNLVLCDSRQAAVGTASRLQRGILSAERQRYADPLSAGVGDGLLCRSSSAVHCAAAGDKETKADPANDCAGQHWYSCCAEICEFRYLYD